MTDQQIVIKDANDTIIAVKTLSDGTMEASESGSGFFCRMVFSIDLPDSDFYTVYLNDERITTYQKSQFPIDDFDGVWISL